MNEKLLGKCRFESFFDLVFVSAKCAQIVDEVAFGTIIASGGVVAVETSKFVLPLPKAEQKSQFVKKVKEYAAKHNLKNIAGDVM